MKQTPIPTEYYLRISNDKNLIKDLVYNMKSKEKLPLLNSWTIDKNEIREKIKKVLRRKVVYKENAAKGSFIKLELISRENLVEEPIYFVFKIKKDFEYILEVHYLGIEKI